MGLVLFAGTPLNFIVLFVTLKYKKLRVPLNYILVNISLLGSSLSPSPSARFRLHHEGYFFLGHTMCALESAMGSIAGLVTAWSLAVLSFERYLVICKPFGAFKFGSNHALAAVAFTWIMGSAVLSLPFWLEQVMLLRSKSSQSVVVNEHLIFPCSFVTCYGPYALAALYFAYSSDENKDYRLVTIPAFFSKSSCVYNPLIYAFMNKQFNSCIMETVFGKKMDESSEVSSRQRRHLFP
ncbi:hypothetical protein INR49_022780, partial [Caranx melampygus]